MSTTAKLMMLATMLILSPSLPAAQQKAKPKKNKDRPQPTALFDGKTLTGWDAHLVGPNVKPEDVWSVQDGVLVCRGEPLGYLATKRSFQNFILTLEWRWAPGKEPGNSGVLMRAVGEPIGFMPKCIEAQLKSGSAGDIWAFRGCQLSNDSDRFREVKDHEALGDFIGVARMADAEKEPGQWNAYKLVFKGDKLTVFINGERVNTAKGCDQAAGPIGLQSEGAEIHFRSIQIVPLD